MPEIKLSDKTSVVVSDEDYEFLSRWNWHAHDRGYAQRNQRTGRRRGHTIYMHRVIAERAIGAPIPEGYQVDHVDGDKRNNQRSNLRLATHCQNMRNINSYRGSSSQYKGVSWHKHKNKWIASIKIDGKGHHLGYFHSEEEAGRAYDARAKDLHGEFARLNFPEE